MKTIVAYSEGKQAEMDRPSPVSCDRIPDFPDIPNIIRAWSPLSEHPKWQHVEGTRVSLYAAYYDQRTPQHYVRVLGIFHGRNVSSLEELYCQTRSTREDQESVEVVAAKLLEIWWQDWDQTSNDVDTPLLLSCPLTEPLNEKSAVSIVTEPCDNPTNGFHVTPISAQKYSRKFTVCVKDMNFADDITLSLVEWVETNRLLGAEMIDIYVDSVHKNTETTLLRYQAHGLVRLFQVPIKNTARSLWQRRRDHLVTYNDCLYRNILESKFIIPLDVDEVLVPKTAYTWHGLFQRLPYQGWDPNLHSAVLVRNVFFFNFMQDFYKSKISSDSRSNRTIYMKRDDVRIEDLLNKVASVDSHSFNSNRDYKEQKDCMKSVPVPKLTKNTISSATISPIGYYSKSFMQTKKVLTAFNHYPLASVGATGFTGWAAPFKEVQLNHYKESCNTTMVPECAQYVLRARIDRSAVHLTRRLTRAVFDAMCSQINAR
ncbi:unnamed protein product [Leptosia nina]|uniref:Glycosyltransferase family 92 protein n=1 Tax=Leptosia nina TaxID=320188 RepID=A0AAV1JNP7_9NEOP